MQYPHLFSEGHIGKLTVRNRSVLVPMAVDMANFDGTPSERITDYYVERARGGVGLLITGIVRVNSIHGGYLARQLSLSHNRHIEPFARMVESVHEHGAKIFPQLHHPGRQGLCVISAMTGPIELAGRVWPGFYKYLQPVFAMTGKFQDLVWALAFKWPFPPVMAPSPVMSRHYNQKTRGMMRWEIKKLERDFVDAAARAQRAGADGVELHASHGYLIQQFLSTQSNRRKDEYGGSLENRMRFVTNIIEGVRRSCGPDFPICVRLTVDEFYREIGEPGQGIELEEGVEMARRLERAGIDAINVSSASYETFNWWMEPMSFECGWRKHLAAEVKSAVSIPVIAANLIRTPEQAERQLADGIQDFIGLGRPLLADPYWVKKAQEGRADEITRCICCLRCIESLEEKAMTAEPLECALNPHLARERETAEPRRDGAGRTVAIVGAGPAGLMAAQVLASRDFKPVVLESSDSAGGQLKLAGAPPKKEKMAWAVDDLEAAARRSGAEIRYNSEASAEVLGALDPYAVIVATGAEPVVPRIPGVDQEHVCTVRDILNGSVQLEGKRVAVIGSGLTGLETAEKLAEEGNRMLVVEMQKDLGPGAYWQLVDDVMRRLKEYHTEFLTAQRLVDIGEDVITLEDVNTGAQTKWQADAVVLAVGVKSVNRLTQELNGHFPVLVVGDARAPGRIVNAVHDAFDTAWNL